MRLTVHVKKAPFVMKEQKVITTDGVTTKKPKKPKCIINTFTFKNLRNWDEVKEKFAYVKSHYGVRVAEETTDKWKKGDEMFIVQGIGSNPELNLSKTLKNYIRRINQEAEERAQS